MPCLRIGRVINLWMKLFESSQIKSSQIKFCLEIINLHTSIPSIAQLVERRTVDVKVVILRSLVRIRLEGIFFSLLIVNSLLSSVLISRTKERKFCLENCFICDKTEKNKAGYKRQGAT